VRIFNRPNKKATSGPATEIVSADDLQALRARVDRLYAFASPFAESGPVMPSPALPSDFIGCDYTPYLQAFRSRSIDLEEGEIAAALARDTAPIPAEANREGYAGGDDFAYWISGYAEYRKLSDIARENGVEAGALFDFGGSTGRVFRNFFFQGDWDVWSCDFKESSVQWNLANMPPAIRVFQGLYQPYLPMEDRSIDLVIAMSVFTHIDELETNWLMELRRILKPGGLAVLTTHNEATWTNMDARLKAAIEQHSPNWLKNETLPPGRHVSTFRLDDPYRCNVFHSDDYVKRNWGRYFDVIEILPRASDAQAIVVLRK
jgi:SAM-dependent methyltransferase